MKDKISIFMLIVLVTLGLFVMGAITSCGDGETTFDSSGLLTMFIDNAPPSEINYGISFPIYVEAQNLGGYDIPAGAATFYLTGIGQNLIGVQSKLINTNVLVKKTETQLGGSEVLTFAREAQAAQQLPQPFNLTMKLTSCYDYASFTQTSICVGESGSVCSLEGNKIDSDSNTAAPIQIEELTEQLVGNKLTVSFKISNLGTGEVYLLNSDCDKIEQEDINEQLKRNRVNILIRTDQGFACNIQSGEEPYNSIAGLEGSVQLGYLVSCEKTLATGESTHISPIEIVLSYKYKESTTKTMTLLP
ncbi:MAG: hypothetical protein JSW08_00975 [archaeon]|nr:MAG: hypothetical protein JSW08_00975 [archaeon]